MLNHLILMLLMVFLNYIRNNLIYQIYIQNYVHINHMLNLINLYNIIILMVLYDLNKLIT